jgi:hypothetical protein
MANLCVYLFLKFYHAERHILTNNKISLAFYGKGDFFPLHLMSNILIIASNKSKREVKVGSKRGRYHFLSKRGRYP